jgi:hypothetical protein
MTFLGEFASSSERSPSERRFTKSGFAVPPPEPAKSGWHGVPLISFVPPNPYGDIGAMRVMEATESG